jgi:SagB-type dehydrogenase family enzyme
VIDQNRMRSYQTQEADDDRFKDDYLANDGIDLPAVADVPASASVRDLWGGELAGHTVSLESLSATIALAFGATGERIPVTDSAPLLRRSSPSGGGRHPSEGYVVVRDVAGLDPGWYHVTMKPFSLRRAGTQPVDSATLQVLFPATFARFRAEVSALVILTTVFERNMYRYREPRTFRTVHMDAGHIAGTVRLGARALGLTADVFDRDDALGIEAALGLNGMREGYLLTVALGHGQGGTS